MTTFADGNPLFSFNIYVRHNHGTVPRPPGNNHNVSLLLLGSSSRAVVIHHSTKREAKTKRSHLETCRRTDIHSGSTETYADVVAGYEK
jgi:hypothetical protein